MVFAKFKKIDFSFKKTIILMEIGFIVFLLWLVVLPYPITNYVSNVSLESSEMTKPLMLSFFVYFSIAWIFIVIGLLALKKHLFLKLWFLFSLFYGMFGTRLGIFVSFPAAILSAFGLEFILKKVHPYEKAFFLILMVLCLIALVPGMFETHQLVKESEKSAMLWFNGFTPKDSSIMSSWDRGHPLAYFAQRKIVIDGYFEFAPGLKERNNSMKLLIRTNNCEKIKLEVSKFEIDYFFIHSKVLDSITYQNGVLESGRCEFVFGVFESDGSKILSYNLT
jgi:hypothetical protein